MDVTLKDPDPKVWEDFELSKLFYKVYDSIKKHKLFLPIMLELDLSTEKVIELFEQAMFSIEFASNDFNAVPYFGERREHLKYIGLENYLEYTKDIHFNISEV